MKTFALACLAAVSSAKLLNLQQQYATGYVAPTDYKTHAKLAAQKYDVTADDAIAFYTANKDAAVSAYDSYKSSVYGRNETFTPTLKNLYETGYIAPTDYQTQATLAADQYKDSMYGRNETYTPTLKNLYATGYVAPTDYKTQATLAAEKYDVTPEDAIAFYTANKEAVLKASSSLYRNGMLNNLYATGYIAPTDYETHAKLAAEKYDVTAEDATALYDEY